MVKELPSQNLLAYAKGPDVQTHILKRIKRIIDPHADHPFLASFSSQAVIPSTNDLSVFFPRRDNDARLLPDDHIQREADFAYRDMEQTLRSIGADNKMNRYPPVNPFSYKDLPKVGDKLPINPHPDSPSFMLNAILQNKELSGSDLSISSLLFISQIAAQLANETIIKKNELDETKILYAFAASVALAQVSVLDHQTKYNEDEIKKHKRLKLSVRDHVLEYGLVVFSMYGFRSITDRLIQEKTNLALKQ